MEMLSGFLKKEEQVIEQNKEVLKDFYPIFVLCVEILKKQLILLKESAEKNCKKRNECSKAKDVCALDYSLLILIDYYTQGSRSMWVLAERGLYGNSIITARIVRSARLKLESVLKKPCSCFAETYLEELHTKKVESAEWRKKFSEMEILEKDEKRKKKTIKIVKNLILSKGEGGLKEVRDLLASSEIVDPVTLEKILEKTPLEGVVDKLNKNVKSEKIFFGRASSAIHANPYGYNTFCVKEEGEEGFVFGFGLKFTKEHLLLCISATLYHMPKVIDLVYCHKTGEGSDEETRLLWKGGLEDSIKELKRMGLL